jgi:hypothetical protein
MLGTKIEVHLTKADPGSWASLDIPRKPSEQGSDAKKSPEEDMEVAEDNVDALDLDDLDLTPNKLVLSTDASGGRTDAPIV